MEDWRADPSACALVRKAAASLPQPWVRSKILEIVGLQGEAENSAFLQERATRDTDAAVRATALALIAKGWPDDPETINLLQLRALEDQEANTRAEALRLIAAATQHNRAIMTFLKERGAGDLDPRARAAALRGIAEQPQRDQSDLNFLKSLASDSEDPQTRTAALEAIAVGWGQQAEVVAFLQQRAISDPEPAPRAAGIRGNSQGKDSSAAAQAFLQERAVTDPDLRPRVAALETMIRRWPGDRAVKAFLHDLQDKIPLDSEPISRALNLQALVLAALGLGVPVMIKLVSEVARNDPDCRVRAVLLWALSYYRIHSPLRFRMGGPWMANLELPNLELPDGFHEIHDPASYLGDLGESDYLEAMAERGPEIRIRTFALLALAIIGRAFGSGGERASDALAFLRKQAAESSSTGVRSAALCALVLSRSVDPAFP
jgi:hypothetical protein